VSITRGVWKYDLFLPLADFFKGKKRRYKCKVHSRGCSLRSRQGISLKELETETTAGMARV
jgi:hypothetical protein